VVVFSCLTAVSFLGLLTLFLIRPLPTTSQESENESDAAQLVGDAVQGELLEIFYLSLNSAVMTLSHVDNLNFESSEKARNKKSLKANGKKRARARKQLS
jgi:hypothetical protein